MEEQVLKDLLSRVKNDEGFEGKLSINLEVDLKVGYGWIEINNERLLTRDSLWESEKDFEDSVVYILNRIRLDKCITSMQEHSKYERKF